MPSPVRVSERVNNEVEAAPKAPLHGAATSWLECQEEMVHIDYTIRENQTRLDELMHRGDRLAQELSNSVASPDCNSRIFQVKPDAVVLVENGKPPRILKVEPKE